MLPNRPQPLVQRERRGVFLVVVRPHLRPLPVRGVAEPAVVGQHEQFTEWHGTEQALLGAKHAQNVGVVGRGRRASLQLFAQLTGGLLGGREQRRGAHQAGDRMGVAAGLGHRRCAERLTR
jgi:hypothetical protein